jgi:hypothetical protein
MQHLNRHQCVVKREGRLHTIVVNLLTGAKRKRVDPIPDSFSSPEEAGEFWDTHDLADYWDQTQPVTDIVFDITRRRYLIPVERSLSDRLVEVATRRGVAAETLVNLWIKEKLEELGSDAARKTKPKKGTRKSA